MANEIDVSKSGPLNRIRINRPEKKNALTLDMYDALSAAFDAGDAAEDVAVHVVLGQKGVFCAGNDINDFLSFSKSDGLSAEKIIAFLGKLPRIKKPVIAGVDGVAVGVGVTMLLHFDLVYATPGSSFATPFLDLGIVPEAGSSLLMPRLMGYQRAFEMLVLGERFNAERARQAGLINDIVEPDALEAKVESVAKRLATRPPEALSISRGLLRGDTSELDRRIAEEAKLFRARLSSPEAREAFQAFLEKRAPDFSKLRS